MKNVLKMAGNLTSHALWGISEADGLTTIVGYLKKDGSSKMERLALEAEESVKEGKSRIDNLAIEDAGAVLISDNYVTFDSGKTDTLVVDIRFSDAADKKIQYMLPYRSASDAKGFGIYTLKVTKFDGIPTDQVNELTNAFVDGIESHEHGSRVWSDFRLDEGSNSKAAEGRDDNMEDSLVFAPFIVFMLVSAVDGKIDKKEYDAFLKIMQSPEKYKSAVLNRLASDGISKANGILEKLVVRSKELPQLLYMIVNYIDKSMEQDERRSFKHALYTIGEDIAKSSGGFLGFGSKISKEEQAALDALESILGL